MKLEELRQALPSYAKDVKLNLSNVLKQAGLSPVQTWGTAVAVATALGDKVLLDAVVNEAGELLSAEEREAAQGVGTVMNTNNIYYRFCHLAGDKELLSMPAGLRMNALRSSSVSNTDRELWAIAVSSVNGCGLCVESHYNKLREEQVGRDTILAVVRIAATVASLSRVMPLGAS